VTLTSPGAPATPAGTLAPGRVPAGSILSWPCPLHASPPFVPDASTPTGGTDESVRAASGRGFHAPTPVPSSWFRTTSTAFSASGPRVCCTPLPAMRFAAFRAAGTDLRRDRRHRPSPRRGHPTKGSPRQRPYRITAVVLVDESVVVSPPLPASSRSVLPWACLPFKVLGSPHRPSSREPRRASPDDRETRCTSTPARGGSERRANRSPNPTASRRRAEARPDSGPRASLRGFPAASRRSRRATRVCPEPKSHRAASLAAGTRTHEVSRHGRRGPGARCRPSWGS
jgi:hypothetical protein